jgi:hypothetical protein
MFLIDVTLFFLKIYFFLIQMQLKTAFFCEPVYTSLLRIKVEMRACLHTGLKLKT